MLVNETNIRILFQHNYLRIKSSYDNLGSNYHLYTTHNFGFRILFSSKELDEIEDSIPLVLHENFNKMQSFAYNLFKKHHEAKSQNLLIINGTAST